MHRSLLLALVVLSLAMAGCNTATSRMREYPQAGMASDAATQKKIQRGVVEPGYNPEMVYMALGKPTEPKDNIAEATRDGTWIYRNFHRNDRDFVRAGHRRRVVFDPVKRSDVIVTEPIDPKAFPHLTPHSVHIIFRDGRVVEIQRVEEI